MTPAERAERRDARRAERLQAIFDAGYAAGQRDAAEHPLSPAQRNRLSLLITPPSPAATTSARAS